MYLGKLEVLNYGIFLNGFSANFGKCQKLSSDTSQNMLEIHSKICHNNFEFDICFELDLIYVVNS